MATATAADSPRTTMGAIMLVVGLLAGFAILPRVFQKKPFDAPDFALPLVANAAQLGEGKSAVKLSELRGNAVLLDFWATWCGPCRAEAPIVDRFARRWKDRGVVVVGVNEDRADEGDPRAFAQAHGLSYPIASDEGGGTMRKYGADSLPTLVVVSRTGKVTAVRSGLTDDAELEELVQRALQL